jgi:alanine racemase
MHRLGVKPEQVADLRGRLSRCASVRQPVGLFTHFASADEPDSDQTRDQLAQFERATAGLAGERSIANSAAILVWPESHSDWVRPGIMLYGVSPFAERTAAAFDLQPAMTLTSRLIAVNHYRKGDAIGYGASWRCPEDMPVGVVAIGYGDGYPRHAVSGTPVLLNNCRVPLVGRVSMDSISVDLRSQPDAAAGDPVVLWGRGLPVEEIATHAGTIPYELLCRLTTRVRFIESD